MYAMQESKVIGLLTDFGQRDYYVSAMKAVILSICPDAVIIDITHEVEPWNILEGAFILKQVAPYFPVGSVIVGVIDPGVGTSRKPILIVGRRHFFIGPDNGLLSMAALEEGIKQVIKIEIGEYTLKPSGTFDGRDVFAPVAAHIIRGVSPEKIGPIINSIETISLPEPEYSKNYVDLTVLHIDRFGNVVTNAKIDEFLDWTSGSAGFVLPGKNVRIGLARSYLEAEDRVFLIPGSSGFIEISVSKGSAAKLLNIKPGEKLRIFKQGG